MAGDGRGVLFLFFLNMARIFVCTYKMKVREGRSEGYWFLKIRTKGKGSGSSNGPVNRLACKWGDCALLTPSLPPSVFLSFLCALCMSTPLPVNQSRPSSSSWERLFPAGERFWRRCSSHARLFCAHAISSCNQTSGCCKVIFFYLYLEFSDRYRLLTHSD